MMSGVPLKTCWAFNKLWNNKFYYKAASCWCFYWVMLRCTDPWMSNLRMNRSLSGCKIYSLLNFYLCKKYVFFLSFFLFWTVLKSKIQLIRYNKSIQTRSHAHIILYQCCSISSPVQKQQIHIINDQRKAVYTVTQRNQRNNWCEWYQNIYEILTVYSSVHTQLS